jgi:hypothetical protein
MKPLAARACARPLTAPSTMTLLEQPNHARCAINCRIHPHSVFRFRAFLSLRSSSVFSIPRSRSAEGTDAESETEAISLKPSSGKNRVGSRSLSAAHDPKLVAFPVYTSVGPSNVSRIFSSTVAPTNAFPRRKPDAIHRRYLETSPRHCPGRSGRGAPFALRRQGSRPPHSVELSLSRDKVSALSLRE